jgi:hypothetical protein
VIAATLGNPRLHMARKTAVDTVKAEGDRLRCQRVSDHPRGTEGGRTDPEGDCRGTQRPRHRHGARWAVVRTVGREHPWARIGKMGPFGLPPTFPARSPRTISKSKLKAVSRRRGSQGRVLGRASDGTYWAHSGNPAFRRPSINSLAFDCPPRPIQRPPGQPSRSLFRYRRP